VKIRFTCSVLGCLDDLLSGPVLSGQRHTLVGPKQIGFHSSDNSWPLDDFISLSTREFEKIVVRIFESMGPSEYLDFVIAAPCAVVKRSEGSDVTLSEALIRLFEHLDAVFGSDSSHDRLIVAPEEAWLDRLDEYFRLPHPVASDTPTQTQSCLNLIRQLGFPVTQHSPKALLSLVADRWPWLDKGISAEPTLEDYLKHAYHQHLLVTAFPEIFDTWKEIRGNGMAHRLPVKWEYRLGKNWFLIPRQVRELSLADPADGSSISGVTLLVSLAPLLRILS
jgi:hypothetical protein